MAVGGGGVSFSFFVYTLFVFVLGGGWRRMKGLLFWERGEGSRPVAV